MGARGQLRMRAVIVLAVLLMSAPVAGAVPADQATPPSGDAAGNNWTVYGGNFFIQTSSNLQQWVTVLTNTISSNGSVIIADPSACNSNPRFYRGALTD